MNLTILLLLADIFEKLIRISWILTVLSGVASIVVIVASLDENAKCVEKLKSLRKPFVAVFLISLTLFTTIPSQKTIYIIAGVKVTHEVLETETANKAIKLLNQKLDEALGES